MFSEQTGAKSINVFEVKAKSYTKSFNFSQLILDGIIKKTFDHARTIDWPRALSVQFRQPHYVAYLDN